MDLCRHATADASHGASESSALSAHALALLCVAWSGRACSLAVKGTDLMVHGYIALSSHAAAPQRATDAPARLGAVGSDHAARAEHARAMRLHKASSAAGAQRPP
eukprot:3849912-Prymnesium_polylepis.2